MPTSHCRYPDHHTGPGVGAPLGWLAAVGLGAFIVTQWHTVVIVLAVLAVLAALAVPVLLLWHNHGSAYDPELERQATAEHNRRRQLQRRAGWQLTAQPQRPAIEAAPVTHQHLHLHGLSAAEVAELVAQRREQPASSESRQPW